MSPQIFASDFDGVICDGLEEYFASTARAYQIIWSQSELTVNDELKNNFYHLRPVIETGWEMPVLLQALTSNYSPQQILKSWHSVRDEIVINHQLDKKNCAQILDQVRDDWIKNDLDTWLKLHRFYPQILDKLRKILDSNIQFYIVTTKEGRFVQQLLQRQGIELSAQQIIGKESKRPKYETLRLIKDKNQEANENIWFVEDRIQTLRQVQKQSDLKGVKLLLADWGYNTEPEKIAAQEDPTIDLISLSQFGQNL